jgi:hypothetical protein
MLEWKWISAWLFLLVTLFQYYPAALEPLCPSCGHALEGVGKLELLAQNRGWYLGWRRFACRSCAYRHTGMTLSQDGGIVEYQTHRVC